MGLPDKRQEMEAGIIAALIFNTANLKKGTKRRGPGDFFPNLLPPKKPEPGSSTSTGLLAKARAAFGGHLRKAAPDGKRSDPDGEPKPQ